MQSEACNTEIGLHSGALHVADMSWQTCAMPLRTAQTCPLACQDHPISEVQLICAAPHLQHMAHEQQKIRSSIDYPSWAETVHWQDVVPQGILSLSSVARTTI